MSITARVTKNSLDEIAGNLSQIDGIVSQGAGRVAMKWKATTRVRTGEHRDSIHTEKRGDAHYAIVADSDHSAYVELGTRYMRGDHAGVNALNNEKDSIVSEIEDALTP
jgi:HK97 gp10 family phage protein